MPRRTELFPIVPWTGGLNTSSDPAMIPATDLTVADNVVFTYDGARKKRGGHSYFGTAIPAVIKRSSSGTTRTLQFASSVNISSPLDHILVVGEKITVTATGSGNDATYAATDVAIATITTTDIANDTITYTDTGSLSESLTTTSTISVARSSSVLKIDDFWYLDGSNVKSQYIMSGTSQGLFFRYSSDGKRKQIVADTSAAKSFVDGDVTVGTDSIAETSHGYVTGVKGQLTTSGVLPAGLALATNYYVIKVDANNYKLASSYSNAIDEIAVDITGAAGGGTHTFTPSTVTAITGTLTFINMITFNNKCIIAMSGTGNTPKMYDPLVDDEYIDLPGEPVDFSIMREHLGRIFTNQKTNPDRLHYCETFKHYVWNGIGDSGAIDSPIGDGDPTGISAISPSFKGELRIGKRSKIYRFVGYTPEEFNFVPVTQGLGTEAHDSFCAVEEDDLFYVSTRGINSAMTTDQYGAFQSQYISSNIQRTFNSFSRSALPRCQSAWIPTLNSAAFLFTEEDASKSIYLINVNDRQNTKWYRWPNLNATSLGSYDVGGKRVLIYGTSDGRLIRTENGDAFDFTATAIPYRVTTGTVYPNNDPLVVKGFKRISFLYRPTGDFNMTVTLKIDNYPTQSYSFSSMSGSDLLGTTFVLGTSILGNDQTLAPFTTTIDGYGRGITIEIEQTGIDEDIELYGFVLEWESADLMQEVVS